MISPQSVAKRLEQLKTDRSTLDSHLQEIAERILPRQSDFTSQRTRGEKREEKVFDATAALAVQRFTASMDSMLTPQGQKWHGLKASIPELDRLSNVRKYFETVTDRLFSFRYSSKANFANQMHEVYTSLGVFGTGLMLVEPRAEGGIWYKALPLAACWIAENHEGRVDTVFREFKWSALQAWKKWGDKCPERVLKVLQDTPDKEFTFVHVIMPHEDYCPGMLGPKGKKFLSVYYSAEDKDNFLSVDGYHSYPIMVSRYITAPTEIYGRSPAMTVLPDIKMLNEINKTTIRAAHKLVDPPLLIHDDLGAAAINMKPNGLNYGGVTADGRQLIQPLQTGSRVDVGFELMNQKRQIINDAFLVSLFQILVESHTMSATEVIERAREKGALLAPTMSRQQNELLGPMIEREIDILARQGILPEMPPELLEAQGEYEIQYDSPLARAQRSEEAQGYHRTMEGIVPLAQIDPGILKALNAPEILRGLAQLHGMPARWLKDDAQLAAEAQAEMQMAQLQQLIEAAPALSGAQKNLAQAQQIAMAGPAGRI